MTKTIGPDCLDQFFLGNEPAGMLGEIAQNVEGLGPELNLIVPAHQRAALQVKSVIIEAKHLGGDGTHPSDLSHCLWTSDSTTFASISAIFRRPFVTDRTRRAIYCKSRGSGTGETCHEDDGNSRTGGTVSSCWRRAKQRRKSTTRRAQFGLSWVLGRAHLRTLLHAYSATGFSTPGANRL